MPRAHLLFLTLIWPGSALVAAESLSNDRVSVHLDEGVLSLRSLGGIDVRVSRLRLPWPVASVARIALADAVHGVGEAIDIVHANGWRTRAALYDGSPFLHLSTRVVHDGGAAFEAVSLDHAELHIDCGVPVATVRAIGTGGSTPLADARGSYAFEVIAYPESRRGVVCGWLTHERGIGVFFPSRAEGKARVAARIDFGSYRVAPGAERDTETLLVGLFADVRLGVEAYADAVARHYAIELPPSPGVYCTWYHAGASNESALEANAATIARELRAFGLSVVQIDDRWQAKVPKGADYGVDPASIRTTGPIKVFVDSNENFPRGMEHIAREITGRGLVAGIWFMPFAGNFRHPYFDSEIFATNPDGTPFHDERWSGTCIDLSHPKGETFVRRRVRHLWDQGFRYFKIDGMHTGIPSYNIYVNTSYEDGEFAKARLHDPDATPAEAYRKGLDVLREEAPGTFILGCNVSQNMRSMGPAFGKIDAMRIGPDNGAAGRGHWPEVVLGAWHGTNLYFLNGRVWHDDPDPVYVRESIPLESARWMVSWLAVSGAMHTSSEDYGALPADRLDLLRRCLPAHGQTARPVDWVESDRPRIWIAGDGDRRVIGLFNWSADEDVVIRCSLARLGLDAASEWMGWDYWADRPTAPIRGELIETLSGGTCRVIALRPAGVEPRVVSSSRHITQGLMDIADESWSEAGRTLSGRSLVVAGDVYELRVALPEHGEWPIASARFGSGAELESVVVDDRVVRLRGRPARSGIAEWEVVFAPRESPATR